jgi:hypothetical protein
MGDSFLNTEVKADNRILVTTIILDDLKMFVDRQKYDVWVWASSIGGGFTAIKIIFNLLITRFNYHEHDFMSSILRKLFKIKVNS